MTELQPLFDYDALTPAVREMVQEHTGEIRTLARRAAQDIVEIGERLLEVKEALGHGQFQEWVQVEFGWSYRAAARFMQVTDAFKSANLADLNIAPSALYALASGSTPDFIRHEVIEMAQATGQPVTHKAVQERLEAHREEIKPVIEAEPAEAAPLAPAPAQPLAPAAPLTALDNAEMPPKKKADKPSKAQEPYVPLPVEYEPREHVDGTVHLYPKLPDPPKKQEIKEKDWTRAAQRFESSASAALTALGQLAGYDPADLLAVIESPAGRRNGARTRIRLLQERMAELLEKLDDLDGEKRTIDAAPLIEVVPPKKDADRTLEIN